MISRLSKLFVALLIGAVCIYFVTLNQQRVAVSIADGNTVESSAGVVVLFSFALGLLCASLAGSIFAVRGFFREQAQKRQLRMREIRENAILDTRALAASGDLAAAQAGWTKLVGRYPEDPILRIELASSLERAGHTLGAVRVLDEARLKFPENQEIMYRAADVNERAGNLTASIDNLALLVSRRPSSQAIRKARELSLRLDRLEDAREYNDRLREFEGNSADVSAFEGEITARILVRDYKDRPEELSKKLLQHVLNHERSLTALKEIAKLQKANGELDLCAQTLQRAFKIERDPALLREARNNWCAGGFRDKALAAVKTWVRESSGEELFESRLELIKTYLLVGQDHEALGALTALENEPYAKDRNARRELAILRALIAYRARDAAGSFQAFKEVETLELEAPSSATRFTQSRISSL